MSGSHYSLSQEKKWDLLQSLLKHYSHGLKFGKHYIDLCACHVVCDCVKICKGFECMPCGV